MARAIVAAIVLLCSTSSAFSRDDGRYANAPLKPWFEQLSSKKGRCCSDADGHVVLDSDWDSKDGHYRVRIDGEWIDVPDDAVIRQPNLFGRTVVWPYYEDGHVSQIRCFMVGAMM